MQYDYKNQGAIWPNENKDEITAPDYTGYINIEGKDYWVRAWKKRPDAKKGTPSMSFRVTPKEGPTNGPLSRQRQPDAPIEYASEYGFPEEEDFYRQISQKSEP